MVISCESTLLTLNPVPIHIDRVPISSKDKDTNTDDQQSIVDPDYTIYGKCIGGGGVAVVIILDGHFMRIDPTYARPRSDPHRPRSNTVQTTKILCTLTKHMKKINLERVLRCVQGP